MTVSPSKLDPDRREAFLADMRAAVAQGETDRAAAVEANESPDLAAFLAVPYVLGTVTIRPLSVNSLATLEYIGNDCLSDDDGDEPDTWAVWEFLYVLSHEHPAELAASAYEHSRRLRLIRDSQAVAEKGPEYYREYLASLDNLSTRHFSQWDQSIQAFSERLEGVSIGDMRAVVEHVLADAYRQAGGTGEPADAGKKND